MANARIRSRCPAVVWFPALLVVGGFLGLPALGQVPSGEMPPGLNPPELVPPGQPLPGHAPPEVVPPEQIPRSSDVVPTGETIVQVRIVGLKRVPLSKVLPQIHAREGRPFQPDLVEQDVRRLNKLGLFFLVKPSTAQVSGGRVIIYEVSEKPLINEVKYVGNTVNKKKLAEESLIKAGDAMDTYAIEESRRRIEEYYHAHGYPKALVRLAEGSQPSDTRVIFLIDEGARQRFLWTSFEGNTIADDARLRTQIKSKPGILWYLGGDVDLKELEEDKNRLTAYYRSLGFFSARIGREWHATESGKWVTLTYVIDEGPRYVVRNVSIIGNSKFATDQLAELLRLRAGEYFNQNKMGLDVGRLTDTYGAVGYVFAKVEPEQMFQEQPGQLDLVYRIKEGNRYRVGKILVQIKGDYPHTQLTTILNRMSLHPGDIVDTRKLRDSERRLKASNLFLVDPSKGEPPKIVFSPPTAEDLEKSEKNEKEIAKRPKRPDGFRGQSPDDPTDSDELVNLTIQGELLNAANPSPVPQAEPLVAPAQSPPIEQGTSDAPLVVRGQEPDRPNLLRWRSWAAAPATSSLDNQPVGYPPVAPPASTSAAPSFSWSDQGQGSLTTVRGQYTEGVSFPQFNRNAGRASGYAPQATQPSSTTATASPSDATTSTQGWTSSAAPSAVATTQPSAAQPAANSASNLSSPPSANATAPAPAYGNPLVAPPPSGPYFARPGGDPVQPPISRDPTGLLGLPPDEQILPLDLYPTAAETETGKFMFSVGVNSDLGLVGSVIIDEQNFDWTRWPRGWEDIRNATAWRGAGQRFRIQAAPGTSTQTYSVTWQEPYWLNTNVGLGLSAFYYERNYDEWDEQRVGGQVSLGYQFTPDLSGTFAFRGANVNISNPQALIPDLVEVLGNNALYGFRLGMAHSTRDSEYLPTEGHLIEVSFEQVVGSFIYPRAELDVHQYFMLHERPDGSGRHVLSVGGRVAVTGDNTPIYDRYFAGGYSTLRGFEFRHASPVTNGVFVGGDFMALTSVEYMFPITASDALRGVVFVDAGAVERRFDDWSDKIRVAPGVGLRITIPAMGPAPIALDLAFPVSKEPTDQEQIFSFFVGFMR